MCISCSHPPYRVRPELNADGERHASQLASDRHRTDFYVDVEITQSLAAASVRSDTTDPPAKSVYLISHISSSADQQIGIR